MAQVIDSGQKIGHFERSPLQEIFTAQPAVLIGLIAHLIATPLQDEIVGATGRLLRLGRDILATSASDAGRPFCGASRD
jgi:hypothetical protein